MSGKRRRNPSLAGLAGLTADDLAALDAKRVTLQDLADRCGITKQAVSRKVKAMRSAAPTGPIISTGATAAPTASTGPVLIDAHEISVSACLGLLHRAHAALIGPDALGPSALKALSATITAATSELRLLDVMTSADDADTQSTLTVRVMTEEEHTETKRRVELPDDHED